MILIILLTINLNAQIVNYIATAIKQELNYTNEIITSTQSLEDENYIERIL